MKKYLEAIKAVHKEYAEQRKAKKEIDQMMLALKGFVYDELIFEKLVCRVATMVYEYETQYKVEYKHHDTDILNAVAEAYSTMYVCSCADAEIEEVEVAKEISGVTISE